MTAVLVGVDVGTTRIKAVAVDPALTVLGEHSVPTPWRHSGGCAEADPAELASAAVSAATQAARTAGGTALAVGVTGMSETGVLLDRHGSVLAPALAWYDPRGDCDTVRRELGEQAYWRTAGRVVEPVASLPKLLWLGREVEAARRAVRFLSVPEWVVHVLGGDQVNELSLVSRTGLFDVPGRRPWGEALALLGAPASFLGEIVPAGRPVGRAAGTGPEPLRGAVLTVAGHDHQTAAYALGAVLPGTLLDSLGTAEALLRSVPAPLPGDTVERLAGDGVTTGWGLVPGALCLLAGIATGISLERVGRLVGAATPAERRELGRRALATDRARTALRVAATYTDLVVTGVDDEVEPALLWRAAVEDLTAAGARVLESMAREVGGPRDVVVAGGWLHNPMVRAAKDEQYGAFRSSTLAEPGALGAAELAGVAAGVLAPRWDPVAGPSGRPA